MSPEPSSGTAASPLGRFLLRVHSLASHRRVDSLALKPRLVISLAGFLAFVGCMLYAAVNGIPQPAVHDEFSYLLAGDTFASGRLTNPTHPMWRHFETFHVLQQPTYASKYPPGQGVVLAVGQILGHPIVGVWLSVALMAAGISWMVYKWVPPRWALLGSMLAVVQVGFPTYWAQSYWGGALAALGGALVYGSLRAAAADSRLNQGALFGTGAALLAITRPLEGLLAGLPAAAVLFGVLLSKRGEVKERLIRRVVVPPTMILVATVGSLGFYNWRVTGDPLRLPHQVYSETYHLGALFPWQEPDSFTDYRHDVMRDFKRVWSMERHREQRENPLGFLVLKFLRLEGFFLGPGILALFMLPRMIKDRWLAVAAAVTGIVMMSTLLTLSALPHYAAPVTGLILILMVEGFRKLHAVRGKTTDGRRLVTLILISYLPFLAIRNPDPVGAAIHGFGERRGNLVKRLQDMEGDDLVIVSYKLGHSFHEEWVYNRATVDSADIVWARNLSREENQELIQYFRGRRVWSLEVDGVARLQPDLGEGWVGRGR